MSPPSPPDPDFVFSLEVMTADLEFRDLVSRPVLGGPAVMVEECFEKQKNKKKKKKQSET